MIRKIKSINQLAVFNGFDWDMCTTEADGSPMSFGKINIFYGRNYSGKTTLSRILRAFETHVLPDKYDSPEFSLALHDGTTLTHESIFTHGLDIRVFNEDFVRTNLRFLIDPNAEIDPFAILGANNAEIERAISEIVAELGSETAGLETGLYKQLAEAKKKYSDMESALHQHDDDLQAKLKDKAIHSQRGIKYNSTRFGDQNYTTTKLQNEIAVVLASSYTQLSEAEKLQHEQTIQEQVKSPVQKVKPALGAFDRLCEQVTELLKKKIEVSNKISELLADVALSNWVREGIGLHKDKTVCAFCGNPLSDERLVVIHAHFDEESKKLEAEIDALIINLQAEIDLLPSALQIDKTLFYASFHTRLDNITAVFLANVTLYTQQLGNIIEQLKNKKGRLTKELTFTVPEDKTANLINVFATYNAVIDENNKFASGLDKAKNSAQKALRLQEVFDFCATVNYSGLINKKDDLQKFRDEAHDILKAVQSSIGTKTNELQAKRRLLNDEEEGARRVNQYLNDYFGHNFLSLQAEKVEDGQSRIRFAIYRNNKPAFNLSEGECSLISFCYFMAKLNDIETENKKPIIWIDDPISSLDGNHVFFVYSLILSEIVKKDNWTQLFLSTHNLDFLKYIRRLNATEIKPNGKPGSVEKRCFIIQRSGELSSIRKMPKYLSEYATEYNYLFSQILECSKIETVDDSNHDLICNFGNTARRFLEIHLYFKYPDTSESTEKLRKFFGADEIAAELINRLCNESSHGSLEQAQKVGEFPESIPAAKKIIEKLQEDLEQYNSFLMSIGQ